MTLRDIERIQRVKVSNYLQVIHSYEDDHFKMHFRLPRKLAYKLIRKFEDSEIFQKLIGKLD